MRFCSHFIHDKIGSRFVRSFQKLAQGTMSVKRVLFVCIGNACRSPMAEGFANYYGKSWIDCYSAGVHPLGRLMPETIAVMKEKGIDISHQHSKGMQAVPLDRMDYVITLESSLAHGLPQVTPGTVKRSWPIKDPILKPLQEYRRARDEIEAQVLNFIDEIQGHP